MPPIVGTITAIVTLAAQAGPVAAEIYAQAKRLIDWLFNGGLITLEQQEKLKAWADAHEAATLKGEIPPALQVEPDPD